MTIKITPADVRNAASSIQSSASSMSFGKPNMDGVSDVKGNVKAKGKIETVQKTIKEVRESITHYATLLSKYADEIEKEDNNEAR